MRRLFEWIKGEGMKWKKARGHKKSRKGKSESQHY